MLCPETSRCIKVHTLLAVCAYILYIVGFASPFWLEQHFTLPRSMTGFQEDVPVYATMGLLKACKHLYFSNGNVQEECSSEGAADWQEVAAGTGIGGLVFGLFGLIMAILSIAVKKVAGKQTVKAAIIVCYLLTSALMTTSLILLVVNKKMQVDKNLPLEVDFDLFWAYIVAATSAGLFALLVLLSIIDNIWSGQAKATREDQRRVIEDSD